MIAQFEEEADAADQAAKDIVDIDQAEATVAKNKRNFADELRAISKIIGNAESKVREYEVTMVQQ